MAFNLLSKKQQCQLRIIEHLLIHKQESLTQLGKITKCSKKTIISYLKELEADAEFFSYKKTHDSILLLHSNNIQYSAVYHYFYNHSLALNFLEVVLLNPYIASNEAARKLRINKSRLYRIKKSLDGLLQEYGFSLSKSPFHFEGNFRAITNFFNAFMYEKYDFTSSYISNKQHEVIEQLIYPFKETTYITESRLFTLVWTIVKVSQHVNDFSDQLLIMDTNLKKDSFLVNQHLFYEAFSFPYSKHLHYHLEELFQYIKQETKKPLLYPLNLKLNAVIKFIHSIFTVLNTKEFNIHASIYHSTLLIYSSKNFVMNSEKRRFVLEFFKSNGHFDVQTSSILGIELKLLFNAINDIHCFFELLYTILTHEKGLYDQILANQVKMDVGIYYSYGLGHSIIVKKKLDSIFSKYLNFHIIQNTLDMSFDPEVYNCDFYITNLSSIKKENCIVTDIYPSVKDIEYLAHHFKEHTPNILFDFLHSLS